MNYILVVLGTTAVLMGSAVALNWTIDPAGIFRRDPVARQYAAELVKSEHGLVFPHALDDREVKAELAKKSGQYDCVIIGSSRVLQLGLTRKHRSFPRCRSILNLGVSGAGIEDHIAISWLALSAGRPRKLILGVDPWTFAFGKNFNWKIRYEEEYQIAANEISGKSMPKSDPASRWSDLLSARYTQRSLYLLLGSREHDPIEKITAAVDEDIGYKFQIMLPDGSMVPSAESIAAAAIERPPLGGATYLTNGAINTTQAVELYQQLIVWIRHKGVKPILLMPPYHQNVWMLQASPNYRAMVATEAIVRKMGRELDVPVIGSFQPSHVGCSPDDFYDFMHPKASCVANFTAKAEL